MTTFFVFRHGQTDMNKQRRWQGKSVDSPLNDEGRRQARLLAKKMAQSRLDIIYSSPLKRALETAQIIGEALRVPVVADDRLTEASLGDTEGKTAEDIRRLFPKEFADWHNLDDAFLDARFPHGESKREIQQKMIAAMTDLAQKPYQNIGVAAHSAVIRYFILSMGVRMPDIPHDRALKIVFDDGVFRFDG